MRASIEQLDFRFRPYWHIIIGRAAFCSCTEYMHMYKARIILGIRPCFIAIMLGRFDAVQT